MKSLPKSHTVVFTDLDGTLLDLLNQSPIPALPALSQLHEQSIPVIFCSAKTRAEQEAIREDLGITDPFIVENGGAIFIPRAYFSFSFAFQKTLGEYRVIELGIPYHEIRNVVDQIRRDLDVRFEGFGDLSPAEIAGKTGLDPESARRAAAREYDETLFLHELTQRDCQQVLTAIEDSGMRWTHGGRFYHIMGANDKGRAAILLTELYERQWNQVRTVGLGDSLNDSELLAVMDLPILVEKHQGGWEDITLPNVQKVRGRGPVGWQRAIEQYVLH
ncbi:MAG TPA: mannosyl-3-phosphoglycerate phosphatase [bacterium]|nr:mannosyl-3-phosphoglycerate phosphatase [bacterium]